MNTACHGHSTTLHSNNVMVHSDNVTIHGNNVLVHGNNVTLHGNNVLVHGNNVLVHGNNVMVHGNNVMVHGNNVMVHGNNVLLHGNNVMVHGNNVMVHGNNVMVHGNNVMVHGNNVMVHGNNVLVHGNNSSYCRFVFHPCDAVRVVWRAEWQLRLLDFDRGDVGDDDCVRHRPSHGQRQSAGTFVEMIGIFFSLWEFHPNLFCGTAGCIIGSFFNGETWIGSFCLSTIVAHTLCGVCGWVGVVRAVGWSH